MLLLAVVQVGTLTKKFQVTNNKTQRGALTFSGGARPLNAPSWLRACLAAAAAVTARLVTLVQDVIIDYVDAAVIHTTV
jgi:hypothetical protein